MYPKLYLQKCLLSSGQASNRLSLVFTDTFILLATTDYRFVIKLDFIFHYVQMTTGQLADHPVVDQWT